jgi:hypothetical protein
MELGAIYNPDSTKIIKSWAAKRGLDFFRETGKQTIVDRYQESPEKPFFGSRRESPYYKGPYVTGHILNRKVWGFRIRGWYRRGFTDAQEGELFTGWCMEFRTVSIPIPMVICKHAYYPKDTLNTESRKFEGRYSVSSGEGSKPLQLLDPAMIEVIMKYDVSAIEFSDRSVALFTTIYPPSEERLDQLLEAGERIAKQVDLNYPLGKYVQEEI